MFSTSSYFSSFCKSGGFAIPGRLTFVPMRKIQLNGLNIKSSAFDQESEIVLWCDSKTCQKQCDFYLRNVIRENVGNHEIRTWGNCLGISVVVVSPHFPRLLRLSYSKSTKSGCVTSLFLLTISTHPHTKLCFESCLKWFIKTDNGCEKNASKIKKDKEDDLISQFIDQMQTALATCQQFHAVLCHRN